MEEKERKEVRDFLAKNEVIRSRRREMGEGGGSSVSVKNVSAFCFDAVN